MSLTSHPTSRRTGPNFSKKTSRPYRRSPAEPATATTNRATSDSQVGIFLNLTAKVHRRSKPGNLFLDIEEIEQDQQNGFNVQCGSHLVKDLSGNGAYASNFFRTLNFEDQKDTFDKTPESYDEVHQTSLVQNISVLEDNSLTV